MIPPIPTGCWEVIISPTTDPVEGREIAVEDLKFDFAQTLNISEVAVQDGSDASVAPR